MSMMNADPVWMESKYGPDGYVTELRFSWPPRVTQGAFYASAEAPPEYVRQHDDARWERVVRRWEHKRVG
jgi:hypothetical protein